MNRILVVDDEAVRIPAIQEFVDEGVDHVLLMPENFDGYDVVFLDHDLGVQDSYDELRKMDPENFAGIEFIVHSMNPVGAQNIIDHIRSYGGLAIRMPYSSIVEQNRRK